MTGDGGLDAKRETLAKERDALVAERDRRTPPEARRRRPRHATPSEGLGLPHSSAVRRTGRGVQRSSGGVSGRPRVSGPHGPRHRGRVRRWLDACRSPVRSRPLAGSSRPAVSVPTVARRSLAPPPTRARRGHARLPKAHGSSAAKRPRAAARRRSASASRPG